MNYYRPSELKDPQGNPSGYWHYTLMNDGRIRPIGYCAKNDCRHTSPLEASNCYRRYIRQECGGLLPGGFKMDTGDPETDSEELIMTSSY